MTESSQGSQIDSRKEAFSPEKQPVESTFGLFTPPPVGQHQSQELIESFEASDSTQSESGLQITSIRDIGKLGSPALLKQAIINKPRNFFNSSASKKAKSTPSFGKTPDPTPLHDIPSSHEYFMLQPSYLTATNLKQHQEHLEESIVMGQLQFFSLAK